MRTCDCRGNTRPGHEASDPHHARPAALGELPGRLGQAEASPGIDHQTGWADDQSLCRFQSSERRRSQHGPRHDQIELTRPPTGGALAGQPPARRPARPRESAFPRESTDALKTAEVRRARQSPPPGPRRRRRRTPSEDPAGRPPRRPTACTALNRRSFMSDFLGFPCMKPIHRQ